MRNDACSTDIPEYACRQCSVRQPLPPPPQHKHPYNRKINIIGICYGKKEMKAEWRKKYIEMVNASFNV